MPRCTYLFGAGFLCPEGHRNALRFFTDSRRPGAILVFSQDQPFHTYGTIHRLHLDPETWEAKHQGCCLQEAAEIYRDWLADGPWDPIPEPEPLIIPFLYTQKGGSHEKGT